MKECNYETLQDTIAKLPKYEAPDFVWANIERALVEDEQDTQIAKAIPELPVFEAPKLVWSNIEAELETIPPSAKRRSIVVQLGRIAIAASFLGFAIWFGWNQFSLPCY